MGQLSLKDPRRLVAFGVLLWAVTFGVFVMAGCAGGAAREKPPDQRYGHRYEERGPEGRRTLAITPPDMSAAYSYYDVPVSEVVVRTASFEAGGEAVPAEVLVKGALPNDCLALHEAEQNRDGHLLSVTFTMRWPEGADCERFERPFRFYLPLEGRYAPGDYTLKLNGTAYPFTVRR